jgi:hypothetical protein
MRRAMLCTAIGIKMLVSSVGAAEPASPSGASNSQEVVAPDELLKRLEAGALSSEQITAGATAALHAQADENTLWDSKWGKFVEGARKAGRLSDEQWGDYLLGAVRFKIRVGRGVKRSAGLPIWINQESARTGGDAPPARAVGVREVDLSGIRLISNQSRSQDAMNLALGSGHGSGWTEELTDEHYAALQPGPQTFHYRYRITVFDARAEKDHAEKPLGERVVEGTIPWRLLGEDEAPLLPAMQPNPDLRSAIEKSFRADYALRDDRDKTLVDLMIQVDHPPTNMAFDVVMRANGELLPLGPVAWANDKISSYSFQTDLPENVQTVDLILTPSAKAATGQTDGYHWIDLMDVAAVWDGPAITLSNIRVQTQRLGLKTIHPLAKQAAFEYALAQMDASDSAAQRMKHDGNTVAARGELERRIKDDPGDVVAHYELGCILVADGDENGAMAQFVEARQWKRSVALSHQIQAQQRRLCSLWSQRAEKEDAAAMAALGMAYEQGWGVAANAQEAKRWYRNASNAGQAEAMFHLAAMYEQKVAATVHTSEADQWYHDEALTWYRQAASLGNEDAKHWLSTHER